MLEKYREILEKMRRKNNRLSASEAMIMAEECWRDGFEAGKKEEKRLIIDGLIEDITYLLNERR